MVLRKLRSRGELGAQLSKRVARGSTGGKATGGLGGGFAHHHLRPRWSWDRRHVALLLLLLVIAYPAARPSFLRIVGRAPGQRVASTTEAECVATTLHEGREALSDLSQLTRLRDGLEARRRRLLMGPADDDVGTSGGGGASARASGAAASAAAAASDRRVFLFIGVVSHSVSPRWRDAARRSWVAEAAGAPGVIVRFFVSQQPEDGPEAKDALRAEASRNADLIILDGSTGSPRTSAILEHAVVRHSAAFAMKAEEDSWVDASAIVEALLGMCRAPRCEGERIYFGHDARAWMSDGAVNGSGTRAAAGEYPALFGQGYLGPGLPSASSLGALALGGGTAGAGTWGGASAGIPSVARDGTAWAAREQGASERVSALGLGRRHGANGGNDADMSTRASPEGNEVRDGATADDAQDPSGSGAPARLWIHASRSGGMADVDEAYSGTNSVAAHVPHMVRGGYVLSSDLVRVLLQLDRGGVGDAAGLDGDRDGASDPATSAARADGDVVAAAAVMDAGTTSAATAAAGTGATPAAAAAAAATPASASGRRRLASDSLSGSRLVPPTQDASFLLSIPDEDVALGMWLLALDLRRVDSPRFVDCSRGDDPACSVATWPCVQRPLVVGPLREPEALSARARAARRCEEAGKGMRAALALAFWESASLASPAAAAGGGGRSLRGWGPVEAVEVARASPDDGADYGFVEAAYGTFDGADELAIDDVVPGPAHTPIRVEPRPWSRDGDALLAVRTAAPGVRGADSAPTRRRTSSRASKTTGGRAAAPTTTSLAFPRVTSSLPAQSAPTVETGLLLPQGGEPWRWERLDAAASGRGAAPPTLPSGITPAWLGDGARFVVIPGGDCRTSAGEAAPQEGSDGRATASTSDATDSAAPAAASRRCSSLYDVRQRGLSDTLPAEVALLAEDGGVGVLAAPPPAGEPGLWLVGMGSAAAIAGGARATEAGAPAASAATAAAVTADPLAGGGSAGPRSGRGGGAAAWRAGADQQGASRRPALAATLSPPSGEVVAALLLEEADGWGDGPSGGDQAPGEARDSSTLLLLASSEPRGASTLLRVPASSSLTWLSRGTLLACGPGGVTTVRVRARAAGRAPRATVRPAAIPAELLAGSPAACVAGPGPAPPVAVATVLPAQRVRISVWDPRNDAVASVGEYPLRDAWAGGESRTSRVLGNREEQAKRRALLGAAAGAATLPPPPPVSMAWSRDGSRLAFTSAHGAGGCSAVFVASLRRRAPGGLAAVSARRASQAGGGRLGAASLPRFPAGAVAGASDAAAAARGLFLDVGAAGCGASTAFLRVAAKTREAAGAGRRGRRRRGKSDKSSGTADSSAEASLAATASTLAPAISRSAAWRVHAWDPSPGGAATCAAALDEAVALGLASEGGTEAAAAWVASGTLRVRVTPADPPPPPPSPKVGLAGRLLGLTKAVPDDRGRRQASETAASAAAATSNALASASSLLTDTPHSLSSRAASIVGGAAAASGSVSATDPADLAPPPPETRLVPAIDLAEWLRTHAASGGVEGVVLRVGLDPGTTHELLNHLLHEGTLTLLDAVVIPWRGLEAVPELAPWKPWWTHVLGILGVAVVDGDLPRDAWLA